MTVPAAPETILPDVLSPELVLVSPPEVASLARLQLPVSPPPIVALPIRRRVGRVELVVVHLFCLIVTIGPLLLALLTRGTSPSPH